MKAMALGSDYLQLENLLARLNHILDMPAQRNLPPPRFSLLVIEPNLDFCNP
jgi:hypothetical protein